MVELPYEHAIHAMHEPHLPHWCGACRWAFVGIMITFGTIMVVVPLVIQATDNVVVWCVVGGLITAMGLVVTCFLVRRDYIFHRDLSIEEKEDEFPEAVETYGATDERKHAVDDDSVSLTATTPSSPLTVDTKDQNDQFFGTGNPQSTASVQDAGNDFVDVERVLAVPSEPVLKHHVSTTSWSRTPSQSIFSSPKMSYV